MKNADYNFKFIIDNIEKILKDIEPVDGDDRDIIVSYGNDKKVDEDTLEELNLRYVITRNSLENLNFDSSISDSTLSVSFMVGGQHRVEYGESSVDLTVLLTKYLNLILKGLLDKFNSSDLSLFNMSVSDIDYIPLDYARDDVELDSNVFGDKGIYIQFYIDVDYKSKF